MEADGRGWRGMRGTGGRPFPICPPATPSSSSIVAWIPPRSTGWGRRPRITSTLRGPGGKGCRGAVPCRWGRRARAGSAGRETDRPPGGHSFKVSPPEPVDRDLKRLARIAARAPTLILCDNEGQLERLGGGVGGGGGGRGGPPRGPRPPRRYRAALAAPGVGPLRPGDYVVHLEHGIGRYRGTQTIAMTEGAMEVAVLEYQGGDRLNVPLYTT